MSIQSPLCVTLGDPAGCGPSITIEAWHALKDDRSTTFYVRGDPGLYSGIPIVQIAEPQAATSVFADGLPILALETPTGQVETGKPNPASAPAILESIERGVEDVLNGHAGALVTNPISKALLTNAGFAHPGHTEFLAALCAETGEAVKPVMMLVGGGLRVALATIHLPLREAIDAIRPERLERVARTVHSALQTDFGIGEPKLVFTGLNPHAGEAGTLGSEERDIVNPVAAQLRAEGIAIDDARPADTVFAEALTGRFDAVIAMTHDQGLIPVKTLDFWGGVNTTLGLPIVRTSPDHGTAYDAARLGEARPDSLIAAIRLAAEMAETRARQANG